MFRRKIRTLNTFNRTFFFAAPQKSNDSPTKQETNAIAEPFSGFRT